MIKADIWKICINIISFWNISLSWRRTMVSTQNYLSQGRVCVLCNLYTIVSVYNSNGKQHNVLPTPLLALHCDTPLSTLSLSIYIYLVTFQIFIVCNAFHIHVEIYHNCISTTTILSPNTHIHRAHARIRSFFVAE